MVAVAALAMNLAAPRAALAEGEAVGSGSDYQLKPVKDPEVNSPKEALRKTLFADRLDKPGCVVVKSDPHGVVEAERELDYFLKVLMDAIKKKNELALQPLFHQRTNTTLAAIGDTFGRLDLTYGAPFDVSLFRLFAINSVDGTPVGVPCEGDSLSVFGLYGYPLQFGAWLSVMGQKELGRIYVGIVPADGRWNIGSFHVQQWTHAGRDYMAWAKEALEAKGKGHREAAFVKYDLAVKLLEAGNYLELAAKKDLEAARNASMTQDAWDKSIKGTLKSFDVIHTATLFVEGGAAILVRLRVPGEISVENIKKSCRDIVADLGKNEWTDDLVGVRCGYNLPKEPADKDGVQGGIFLSFKEVKEALAKEKAKKP